MGQQLRGFLPWVAFAVLNGVLDWRVGSTVALVLSLGLLALSLRDGHAIAEYVIECSATVFFAVIAILAFLAPHSPLHGYTAALAMTWLGLTAWGSVAVRRPFTLGIARRGVPERFWRRPEFLRLNTVITTMWAAAFTLTALVLAVVQAALPHQVVLAIVVQVAGFVVPARFTQRHAANARSAAAMAGARP